MLFPTDAEDRLLANLQSGKPSLCAYVFSHPNLVEVAGLAGFEWSGLGRGTGISRWPWNIFGNRPSEGDHSMRQPCPYPRRTSARAGAPRRRLHPADDTCARHETRSPCRCEAEGDALSTRADSGGVD
jgi:hypothetical protein